MHSVRAVCVLSTVMLVPFLYYSTSVPVACAVPNDGYNLTDNCTGKETDKTGKTCCWTAYEGPDKGKKVCQTCYTKQGTDGSYMQSCSPVKPAAFKSPPQTLQPGTLPNVTLSQSEGNDSTRNDTLALLQSDLEDGSAEDTDAQEQDQEDEEGDDENQE
jgi:hypothetical protein